MKLFSIIAILGFLPGVFDSALCKGKQAVTADTSVTVPVGGNTWQNNGDSARGTVTNDGIVNWTSQGVIFTTWVRIAKKGKVRLSLGLSVPGGESRIAVSIQKVTRQVTISGPSLTDHYAGEWTVTNPGYLAIRIKGVSKTGNRYADVKSINLSGSAVNAETGFVRNNEGNFFYWGRRGPSVHLSYAMPEKVNAEWFYNEVTVTTGNDVTGSYFMADGFAEGYFGMQVNSPTERRILFSVWSPFKTDDPKQIPAGQKIILLKKGAGVHGGEFGNEGAGGQSYLVYNWKAGNTYKFLLRAVPAEGLTTYTAWFFAPELNRWRLIASFSRPQTTTYLKHLHSFLENFDPEHGDITREVQFGNQWLADENGKWLELNQVKFTTDNTGIKGYRMDYAGGILENRFYLKNCGFFNHYTTPNTLLERALSGKKPEIDLDKLP